MTLVAPQDICWSLGDSQQSSASGRKIHDYSKLRTIKHTAPLMQPLAIYDSILLIRTAIEPRREYFFRMILG